MRDRIEDLSVHARRGELGESGLRQLAIALRASREARLLHEAGCEFDQLSSVLPGDDALARRIVARVLSSRERKARKHGRRYVQVALAAFAWTAAAAAAAPLLVGSEVIRQSASVEAAVGYRTPLVASRARVMPLDATTPEAKAAATVTIVAENKPSINDGKTPVRHVSAKGPRELGSSAQAFMGANRLRRQGRTSEAIQQYLLLQKSFPGTDEARNADISLGLLRLQTGAPDAALLHFHRYLEHNSNSQLIPEALFGEAQALDALGRRAAALRSYASLLRRYPNSAYASTARAKLQNRL